MPRSLDEVINWALDQKVGEELVLSDPDLRAKMSALSAEEKESRAREQELFKVLWAEKHRLPRRSIFRSLSVMITILGDDVAMLLTRVANRRSGTIFRPPGLALDHFAQFVYSKRTYQNTFKPMIDDHRIEHMEALHVGAHGKAKWIAARCNILTLWSMIAHLPFGAIKLCVDLLKKVAM